MSVETVQGRSSIETMISPECCLTVPIGMLSGRNLQNKLVQAFFCQAQPFNCLGRKSLRGQDSPNYRNRHRSPSRQSRLYHPVGCESQSAGLLCGSIIRRLDYSAAWLFGSLAIGCHNGFITGFSRLDRCFWSGRSGRGREFMSGLDRSRDV